MKNKTIQESVLFFVLSAALLCYSLYGQYSGSAPEWKLSPYLFPTLISLLLLALSGSLLWEGMRALSAECKGTPDNSPNLRGVLAVTGMTILYCLAMPIIGFLLSTVFFLTALLWYLGERRRLMIAAIAASCAGLCYIVFDLLLHVMLP